MPTYVVNLTDVKQILFENWFKGSTPGMKCFLTINCTDCPIQEILNPFCAVWNSFKFKGPGVRYKIAICILTGEIVWVIGPFPAGITDSEIYNRCLSKQLGPDEFVEADSGYKTCPKAKIPGVSTGHDQAKRKSQARGRHETVNGKLKVFSALTTRSCHFKLGNHCTMFVAAAVATQVSFKLGQNLPFMVGNIGNY